MSAQAPKIFSASITTGSSLSSSINLGGGYLYISVLVPASGAAPIFTNGGGTPVWIQGSTDNVTFFRLFEVYTNAVANAFTIQSSVCAALIPITYFNFQYAKIEISGTVTGAGGPALFKLIATDSL